MNSNETLRNVLETVTKSHISSHERLMMERTSNHTIKMLSNLGDNNAYNCVMYALDLHNDIRYIDLAEELPELIHADTLFLGYLIEKGALIPSQNGNLIVYSNDIKITHIGKIDSAKRVTSKWGTGHLYEHAINEVPSSYGDNIGLYQLIANVSAFWYFEDFADKSLKRYLK